MARTAKPAEVELESIPSEEEDIDSQPAAYDIVTYPADYTLEVLATKLDRDEILVPGYQRKFVWSIKQSSRLIESFLLGLPVPAVFLYNEPETNKLLVVDGQQRLLSVSYYFRGTFGEEVRGRRRVFRLTGLNERSPHLGKTFEELSASDEGAVNRLKNAVLRAFVVQQLRPEDHSCVFHVFERLNTGGTLLVGQEIRNCVYHGPFNEAMIRLNRLPEWRDVLGRKGEDKRMRDIELILRFFALHEDWKRYQKPMKEFLNAFMKKHQHDEDFAKYESLFVATTRSVLKALRSRPFHIKAGLNAAVFDAVYVAFARGGGSVPADVRSRFKRLIRNEEFLQLVGVSTTDERVVRRRLDMAREGLFGG